MGTPSSPGRTTPKPPPRLRHALRCLAMAGACAPWLWRKCIKELGRPYRKRKRTSRRNRNTISDKHSSRLSGLTSGATCFGASGLSQPWSNRNGLVSAEPKMSDGDRWGILTSFNIPKRATVLANTYYIGESPRF